MLLIAIGFAIGAFGTLIGVGGGILLVPILLHMHPDAPAVWVGAVSMGMVALNATSGSITYYFKRTVLIRAGLIFALASLPGAALGVYGERLVSRELFERVFGLAMVVLSGVIFVRSGRRRGVRRDPGGHALSVRMDRGFYVKGVCLSFGVGAIASFLGIGGGVLHVPLMTEVLGFPVHLATGTSHFILAITAWFTVTAHLISGHITLSDPALWQVGLAAAAGAQLGAYLSPKVSGSAILRLLAVALLAVGLKLLVA